MALDVVDALAALPPPGTFAFEVAVMAGVEDVVEEAPGAAPDEADVALLLDAGPDFDAEASLAGDGSIFAARARFATTGGELSVLLPAG